MFQAILATQWKWSRLQVLLISALLFALPFLSVNSARDADSVREFIGVMERWGTGYAFLAGMTGLLIALAAWQQDHQARHVYALTLPVSRPRYVLMRLAAGSMFLLPALTALLIGSAIAAMMAVPDGLHAYPLALTLRFALAAAVAYAIFFAISSATPHTAGVILGVLGAVLLTEYVLQLIGDATIMDTVIKFLFARPGVLSVFTGRWTLIDV